MPSASEDANPYRGFIGIGNMELCLQLGTVGRTRYEDHFPPPRSLPQMPN
jgi:hypothetical protein